MTVIFKASLLDLPADQMQGIVVDLISRQSPDLAEMGKLAAGLFRGTHFSLAAMVFARWTELQPANPEPWSNLGLCMLRLREPAKARQLLEYALEIDPGFIAARINLGDVYKELGLEAERLATAQACVTLQPGAAIVHNNLGTALKDAGRTSEARQAFAQALRLEPENFEARFNLARLASDDGDTAAATAFFEDALADSGLDRLKRELVKYHLSYEYLSAGDLTRGWGAYEYGFSTLVPRSIARLPDRRFHVPIWDGQPLMNGQRLMVWREQGIGDEIRFLALLPLADIGNGHLIIETEPRLIGILQRSFPQATVREQQLAGVGDVMQTQIDFDFHLPAGSLPRLLMKSRDVYGRLGAYLKASPVETKRFAQRLAGQDDKLKVGICWRSHQLSANRNRKYTAIADWYEVLSTPNTLFVNLQYGECEAELQAMEAASGTQILRWSDVNLKDDLEAVLGIMENLDLVISPSTAVLPLAGALGKPTVYLGQRNWILLGEQDRYPWFRSVRPLIVPPTEPVSSTLQQVPQLIERMTNGI